MSELLAKRYTLGEILGVGASATVYAAFDEVLQLPVAIKLLHPHLEEEGARQIISEANIAMSLTHPNIVAYHGAYSTDGRHFIVLERFEGVSLTTLLEAGPLPIEQIRSVLTALASALAYAHSKGILHRDVSPGNILIAQGDQPTVKLIDFGIAKFGISSAARTQTQNIGTPAFAAPEQLAGKPTTRSDLYGLGAVGFHMLCGSPPSFERGHTFRGHFPATTPTQLADLINSCLAFDPSDRPASAEDLLSRLTASESTRTVQDRRRKRIAIGFGTLLSAALIFITIAVTEVQLRLFYLGAKLEQSGLVEWRSPILLQRMIHSAASFDDLTLLTALLGSKSLSPDSRTQLIEMAFAEALTQGSVNCAGYLIDQGARFTNQSPLFEEELLSDVLHSESAELLELIIKRGYDIDAALESRNLFSVVLSQPTLAQYRVLANHLGERTNERAVHTLPLLLALDAATPQPLEILTAAGSGAINAVDSSGATALLHLASQAQLDQIKRALRIPGIDVNKASREGHTALTTAITEANIEMESTRIAIIRELLAGGVDPNLPDHTLKTPLMVAAGMQEPQLVELLLNHPNIGPIDQRDQLGFTALRHAIDPGVPFNPETLKLLLARGASLEVRDAKGSTVRHVAERLGRETFLPPSKLQE